MFNAFSRLLAAAVCWNRLHLCSTLVSVRSRSLLRASASSGYPSVDFSLTHRYVLSRQPNVRHGCSSPEARGHDLYVTSLAGPSHGLDCQILTTDGPLVCSPPRREQAAEAMELHATAHAVVPGQLDRLLHMCAPSPTEHPHPDCPTRLRYHPLTLRVHPHRGV